MSTLDKQVGGEHYKKYKIQPIEFIVANNLEFRVANVIKYVMRYKDKNGMQDLEKAQHYLDMLKEEIQNESTDKNRTYYINCANSTPCKCDGRDTEK